MRPAATFTLGATIGIAVVYIVTLVQMVLLRLDRIEAFLSQAFK